MRAFLRSIAPWCACFLWRATRTIWWELLACVCVVLLTSVPACAWLGTSAADCACADIMAQSVVWTSLYLFPSHSLGRIGMRNVIHQYLVFSLYPYCSNLHCMLSFGMPPQSHFSPLICITKSLLAFEQPGERAHTAARP